MTAREIPADELAEAERWLLRMRVAAHNHDRAMAQALGAELERRGAIEQRARMIARNALRHSAERATAREILGEAAS